MNIQFYYAINQAVHSSLLHMQRLYSEVASSITMVAAARVVLNKQRHYTN